MIEAKILIDNYGDACIFFPESMSCWQYYGGHGDYVDDFMLENCHKPNTQEEEREVNWSVSLYEEVYECKLSY